MEFWGEHPLLLYLSRRQLREPNHASNHLLEPCHVHPHFGLLGTMAGPHSAEDSGVMETQGRTGVQQDQVWTGLHERVSVVEEQRKGHSRRVFCTGGREE
jgi:hypothetical protein